MKESLKKICSFAFNSNLDTFKEVFKNDELAEHLWEKYLYSYKSNFLEFYNGGLDKHNKEIVENYIENS